MKLSSVNKAVQGFLLNLEQDLEVKGIKIDSRKISKGDLFIAIKGQNMDGHNYIDEAVKNGAVAVVLEKEINKDIPQIIVKSTLDSLLLLARYIREESNIPVIAITGSVGKTTTKELISFILSSKYDVLKSEGNNNNHIGVPLTFFNLNARHSIAVVELGMNHIGEIEQLSKSVIPNTSIITNVGTSHVGNLGSRKNIKRAKLEILSGMREGNLIINGDICYLKRVSKKNIKVEKVSLKGSKQFSVIDIKYLIDRTEIKLKYKKKIYDIVFNVPGKHLINNVLIAIHTCLTYGISIDDIVNKIKDFKNISNRMNIIKLKKENTLIDDSYNSSYESLMGVLELIEKTDLFKIIILGDILELGKKSYKIHKKIIKKLESVKDALIILVGDEFKKVNKYYEHFSNNESVIGYLDEISINKMIVLLKGSRKMQLEEIKEYLIEKITIK